MSRLHSAVVLMSGISLLLFIALFWQAIEFAVYRRDYGTPPPKTLSLTCDNFTVIRTLEGRTIITVRDKQE